jgi:hypothetical protein
MGSRAAELICFALFSIVAEDGIELSDSLCCLCEELFGDFGIFMVEDVAETDTHGDMFVFMPLGLGLSHDECGSQQPGEQQAKSADKVQLPVQREKP